MTTVPGRLVLVTGPSGVGKDSLLDGARAALAGRSDIVFPRRMVTRPPGLGGEDYIAVSEADFAAMAARGDFALHWPAHGLHYGIPAGIDADLAAGRQVVVNVSRAVIDTARLKYPGLLVLAINASPEVLRQRLLKRGRETPAEIEERLQRAAAYRLEGPDVALLNNDGPLAEGIAAVVRLLEKRD
ncbi:MAG: phosphonate metabolism protein/1,5-bisphosphokinase (PRPP-forming) PhnN [Ferrovibrio sp.]|uniref:phosphonate metabolism protein/1,5-bisphosphokinase (PRPP-forming) PhnN n=1 Tax=Ferrovibrio sp. TaxID=1917215 RepID=UPI00260606A7|nr:phosphonate metabolism protein/1,5-bisphosphokinase (PRPP-forming) PhnN [Ferrovibrio sp.]MCW0233839.1 phosphonate metabolism protein/1,5-bisphosphokinase (PRPP-forming) PhnN [Ferrovibrio sp.]